MTFGLRVASLGLALCIAPLAVRAESAVAPDMQVGDRWIWQHIDGVANEPDFSKIEDVVEVNANEVRTRVRFKGKPGKDVYTYTHEWNPVDIVSAQFSPFLKELSFPLEVGKKWSGTADKRVFKTGGHGTFHVKGEVVSTEKITVPAGTFDTYKIHVLAEGDSTGEDAEMGNTDETIWYAPAVKRYVKQESKFSQNGKLRDDSIFELQEFSLR